MSYRKSSAGALFLILIIIVIVSTCIVLAASLRTDTVAESLQITDTEKEDVKTLNVLFVVQNEKKEMLFSNLVMCYPKTGYAAQVNIPSRIAAVFNSLLLGDKEGRLDSIDAVYKERGIESFRDEVGKMLGVEIPFTVEISSQNIAVLTDLLGGLRIFVSTPIDMTAGDGTRYLLPSGVLMLDGDKVTAYLNYRLETENDEVVYDRYQNVMNALLTAIKDKGSLIFTKKMFSRFLGCMAVNIKDDDAYSLFKFISGINTEDVIKQNIAGYERVRDSKTMLFPMYNGDLAKQVIKQTKTMLISASGSMYVLEIQNGTDRNGLAAKTKALFETTGTLAVIAAINADNNDYDKTVIIDHKGDAEVAQKIVGDFIRCSNIVEADGDNIDADKDFTIILGRDFNGRYVE